MGVGVQGRGGNSAPFPLPFYGDVHMCSLATKNNWDGQPAWPTGSTQPITLTGTSSPNKFFSQKSPITSIRTDTSAGENHQPKGIKWQMAKKPCLQNASKKKKKATTASISGQKKRKHLASAHKWKLQLQKENSALTFLCFSHCCTDRENCNI